MYIEPTKLSGVLILTPRRFTDGRGYFCEVYNHANFRDHGIDMVFVQDNHSFSSLKGTIRGLHYQAPPHAQDKLVRVGVGRIVDVAVDIRQGSPTYGQWIAVELSAKNGKQLLVPKGFLHGFATLEPDTEVLYKCSDIYNKSCEATIRFDDPDIGIDWSISPTDVILSDKDEAAAPFADFDSPFTYTA